MANTLSTKTYRDKYVKSKLDYALRKKVVGSAICAVDRSDAKTIQNPYISAPSVVTQAIAGTYTPGNLTTTDDTLTVTDEFIISGHIFNWEEVLTKFNLFDAALDEMMNSVVVEQDKFVLNNLCEDGTGTYSTPAGGFAKANVDTIFSNIQSQVAGYAESYHGLYIVVENTDIPGIVQAQATSGFNFADSALKNGLIGSHMGVEIYVVRTGTFVDATLGTKTVTNAGHRVAGVKRMATYAVPRGIQFEDKMVTGKTGREIVLFGLMGFKQWATKAALTIDITVTA